MQIKRKINTRETANRGMEKGGRVSLALETVISEDVALREEFISNFKYDRVYGMSKAHRQGSRKVVIASGGNAGMAVAYGARKLGMESVVVLSKNVPKRLVEKLRFEGARVEVKGSCWDEADERAQQIVAKEGKPN